MRMIESQGLHDIAVDLPKLGYKAAKVVHPVIVDGAEMLAAQWRRNAEQTAGTHGKHYPESIDTELLVSTDIAIEVGPNPFKRQGKMSFEEGSPNNQPPHLDGAKALVVVEPLIHKRIDSVLGLIGL